MQYKFQIPTIEQITIDHEERRRTVSLNRYCRLVYDERIHEEFQTIKIYMRQCRKLPIKTATRALWGIANIKTNK